MENLAAHEKCVLNDLDRLLSIKNQSPIDALRDFVRTISRLEKSDYSEIAKTGLLRCALGMDQSDRARSYPWDIPGMLSALNGLGLLPNLASSSSASTVAAAMHVSAFSASELGWLLDKGLRPDIPAGRALPLVLLCVALSKKSHFDEIWSRQPLPQMEDEQGYNLLACSLMKTSQVSAGLWKSIVASGAKFHVPCSNGKTPAEAFLSLEAFPGPRRSEMLELRAAIDAEKLSLQSPGPSRVGPCKRL